MCLSYIKQRFERNPSDPLRVKQEMQPCAFHEGGDEGLFCCGDRGSLKDGVSIVKESLCVCEEGLNVAIVRDGPLGSAVKVRRENYSDFCRFVATVGIKWPFQLFFKKGEGSVLRHFVPKQAMVWLCRWTT